MNQSQVDGLEQILGFMETDRAWDDMSLPVARNQLAYVLATIKHECANVWHPIEEYGKGKRRIYGKPDLVTGQIYYGRGYVQLTWKFNYELVSRELGIDFVNHPDLALAPEHAWAITTNGMRKGWFTRHTLDRHINEEKTDFTNARRVINGLDRAGLLDQYARQFVNILKTATENESSNLAPRSQRSDGMR
jgi:predicted chitinase